MDKITTFKTIITVIVGYGTKQIVKAIISNNTSPESMRDKLSIGVGTIALTAIAISASKDYTDKRIDSYYNAWVGTKDELNKKVLADIVVDETRDHGRIS